ncbi:hypothetical protein [Pseudoalteromonas piscicida]|uniref:hypothetical protein n=1 Tax=Pseudoalteromonas piscicida TaxID=43662 RepID=UPI003C7C2E5F
MNCFIFWGSYTEIKIPKTFSSQAGLIVNTYDNTWVLAAAGRGKFIEVTWLHSFKLKRMLRDILLDTLIHYAETKSPATTATQRSALFCAFPNDDESLVEFGQRWCQLSNSTKKTLKGFINTAVNKLNHKYINKYYEIAKRYRHKPEFNALSSTKGRLTDYEYDSILHNIRLICNQLPLDPPDELEFYQISNSSCNNKYFSHVKSVIAYRLMLQIARRPKQIAALKWCDILPIGVSFSDAGINKEPTYTGVSSLHLRCFKIKQSHSESTFRYMPEKWTIPLSESCSSLILQYRAVYLKGLSLNFKRLGVEDYELEAAKLIDQCPIIPDRELFSADLTNLQICSALGSKNSPIFHLSESNIEAYASRHGQGLSERHGVVRGTNNRLRHTWLCNAAMEGRPLIDICKITNVTLPAARAYLQLGLKERQFIDEHYAANELLKEAFSPKSTFSDSDTPVLNEIGCAVGIENSEPTCLVCEHKTRMVRPIPCYGCPNFRPLLEGNHSLILSQAEAKRDFMRKSQFGDTNSAALTRIEKAIAYIKLTIALCEETKRLQNGLEDTS